MLNDIIPHLKAASNELLRDETALAVGQFRQSRSGGKKR